MFTRLLIVGFSMFILFLIFSGQSGQRIQNIVIAPTETPYLSPTMTPVNLDANKIFDLVNNWRIKKGYESLIKSQTLCDLANERLPEIKTDWSHNGVWKYWNNIPHQRMGENLAKGILVESQALDGWTYSQEHLDNLKGDYTYSCIETDGQYVVEEFATF